MTLSPINSWYATSNCSGEPQLVATHYNQEWNRWQHIGWYDSSNCAYAIHYFDFSWISSRTNIESATYQLETRSNKDVTLNTCAVYSADVAGSAVSRTLEERLLSCEFSPSGTSTVNATISNPTSKLNSQGQLLLMFDGAEDSADRAGGLAFTNAKSRLMISGTGFDCFTIPSSDFCNFLEQPWGAIQIVMGKEIIGDWFYVLVFFPLPISIFLLTRNGAFAGFVCLPLILVINTIDTVVFEVSLTLIAIASGFGFYELIRKRIFDTQ